jgi:hypothetical protein
MANKKFYQNEIERFQKEIRRLQRYLRSGRADDIDIENPSDSYTAKQDIVFFKNGLAKVKKMLKLYTKK